MIHLSPQEAGFQTKTAKEYSAQQQRAKFELLELSPPERHNFETTIVSTLVLHVPELVNPNCSSKLLIK